MASKSKKKAIVVINTNNVMAVQQAESRIIEGVQTLADILSQEQTPGMVASVAHLINVKLMEPLRKQLDMARAVLKEHVTNTGEVSGKNGQCRAIQVAVGTDAFRVEKRVAVHQVPDMTKYMDLLRSKDIRPEGVCKKIVSYEFDEDEAKALIEQGRFTENELDACRKKVESLYIEKV
jgi:sulfur carrier protein ThiS